MNSGRMRIGALVVLPVILASCRAVSVPDARAASFKDVALVALIANPDAWHGKHVRVVGYYHSEFEISGLFMHRVDFDQAITKNAVWLDLPKGRRVPNDQYVLVEGVFDAEDLGHLSLYSGGLHDVGRVEARAR